MTLFVVKRHLTNPEPYLRKRAGETGPGIFTERLGQSPEGGTEVEEASK